VVILDNLSPHKNSETIRLIEQAGAGVRFLPAYSPDLNPIEKMWSKLKEALRSAKARTPATLNDAIARALVPSPRRMPGAGLPRAAYSII